MSRVYPEAAQDEVAAAEHAIEEMTRPSTIPPRAVEVLGATAGAIAGSIAGPIGAIAGAVVGGAVGAVAGGALEDLEHQRHVHDEELDRDIGVIGGNIGEADPDQPPPVIGAFSRATMGVGHDTEAPLSDGPMQNVESD
jgi:hypothetical protein